MSNAIEQLKNQLDGERKRLKEQQDNLDYSRRSHVDTIRYCEEHIKGTQEMIATLERSIAAEEKPSDSAKPPLVGEKIASDLVNEPHDGINLTRTTIASIINQAIAYEREACAIIAEPHRLPLTVFANPNMCCVADVVASHKKAAAAIRARK